VTPYWSGKSVEDFAHGANFAVAGATAMGPEFFWDRGYSAADAETVHLDTQMSWFRELLHRLCPSDLSGTLTMPLFSHDVNDTFSNEFCFSVTKLQQGVLLQCHSL
jgi:hypothetical protein